LGHPNRQEAPDAELGLCSHTYIPTFVTTLNPCDVSRSAAGISGGAAVSLASRNFCLAGGYMMDSLRIRNPAVWNKVHAPGLFIEDEAPIVSFRAICHKI